jgi:5-methylcytosine-specific restriction enzyme subunit McrC
LLIRSENVCSTPKKALKKVMLFFNEVDTIDHHSILWSKIRYHRNNATYKMLINICYLVINSLLLTTQDGFRKLATYLDDQSMHRLYEKFVLEYYKKHYPEFGAAPSHIDWNVDDGVVALLPNMKTDITLQYNGKTLIIDTKYYTHTLQTNYLFNSQTIRSNNMYQIFTYVKNKDVQSTGNVSGVLLYAKTDEAVTPDNDYVIGGNRISVKTLDLNTDFAAIERQLDTLVDQWLF